MCLWGLQGVACARPLSGVAVLVNWFFVTRVKLTAFVWGRGGAGDDDRVEAAHLGALGGRRDGGQIAHQQPPRAAAARVVAGDLGAAHGALPRQPRLGFRLQRQQRLQRRRQWHRRNGRRRRPPLVRHHVRLAAGRRRARHAPRRSRRRRRRVVARRRQIRLLQPKFGFWRRFLVLVSYVLNVGSAILVKAILVAKH